MDEHRRDEVRRWLRERASRFGREPTEQEIEAELAEFEFNEALKSHEYAFDAKLWAVCRVKATSEAEARKKMLDYLDCLDISRCSAGDVALTEASIEDESGETSELFEIDGEPPND